MAGWRARVAATVLLALGTVMTPTARVAGADEPAPVPRLVGEIVVDEEGGQVFVTEGDTVGVYDLDGRPTGRVDGQLGARDLLLRDRTLYVLAAGAPRLNQVDADTLAVTGGWSLETRPDPTALAWADGRIWFPYAEGSLGSLDPATGAITGGGLRPMIGDMEIAATESPARLYVLTYGYSPSKISVIDPTGATPTVLRTSPHSNACTNGQDLAVTPDGVTGWTACGAPYRFNQWDLATLAEPTVALAASHYPRAVALSPDHGFVVGTLNHSRPNVRLYPVGSTEPVRAFSTPSQAAVGMVATTSGVGRIYVGTIDGGLLTIRLAPRVITVAPATVAGAATVTVTGLGMTDLAEATVGGRSVAFQVVSDTTVRLTIPEDLANGNHALLLSGPWGDSSDSPATLRRYGPAAPDVPGQPTAVAAGPHGATVTWPAASEDSWPATTYEVSAWVGGDLLATQVVSERSATFTGLRAGTAHTFTVVAVNDEGRSEASPATAAFIPAGPDVAPFGSIAELVRQQHRDLLDDDRAALVDPWIERLALGTDTPATLVAALRTEGVHSTTRIDPVTRLYLAYFGRPPDPDGLRYWANRMSLGDSIDRVSQGFATSAEFRTLYGSLGNRAFVELVYRNVLGRDGDAAGIAYWTAELDSGRRNRGTVMRGFSESAENRVRQRSRVTVAALWAQMLDRVPTAGELTSTVERLDGGTPVATIAAELLASPEYHDRF